MEIKKKYDGIVYKRTAYAPVPGADADGLRITFDSGVAYRDVLAGERGAGSTFHPLLGLGETIMEVKTAGAYPSWLVEVLGGRRQPHVCEQRYWVPPRRISRIGIDFLCYQIKGD